MNALYSDLPRKLDIETDDWHRLTPDDINDMPALTQLTNYLEFCNAVAQVAHPLVQKQLLDFLYNGFLVPVMGSALLQVLEIFFFPTFSPDLLSNYLYCIANFPSFIFAGLTLFSKSNFCLWNFFFQCCFLFIIFDL